MTAQVGVVVSSIMQGIFRTFARNASAMKMLSNAKKKKWSIPSVITPTRRLMSLIPLTRHAGKA